MKIDLAKCNWKLSGWIPYLWWLRNSVETGEAMDADIQPIPVTVPCSVQKALKDAGILPDWNYGLNYRQCEWVENRHWSFNTEFKIAETGEYELCAGMLDSAGWIGCDANEPIPFFGGCREQRVKLGKLAKGTHRLAIVFDTPERWLGQFGYTSKMPVGKARFNYTWDWTIRLVQIGIGDFLYLKKVEDPELKLRIYDTTADSLTVTVDAENLPAGTPLALTVKDGRKTILKETVQTGVGSLFSNLKVRPWQPNGLGEAKLYDVKIAHESGAELNFKTGFRSIVRKRNPGSSNHSFPWLFEINGVPTFLQGFNWTPLLPNTIDVPDELYAERVKQYREMGVNILRVWGGARREKDIFYRLCDENGIMLWQEFPLSSSGKDNCPPVDPKSMAEMDLIADDYIDKLISHASLVIWSGGNELYYPDGVLSRPCSGNEPMLALIADKLARRDAARGFLPTSPSGDRVWAVDSEYGKKVHEDTHGPWKVHSSGDPEKEWFDHWSKNDTLLASEFGAPGPCDLAIIRKYAGDLKPKPYADNNPYWCRPVKWHAELDRFKELEGREPKSEQEYVKWAQARQARAIEIALVSLKRKFPKCGGAIIWDGHDDFPCPSNCSVIDFHGGLKPAAKTISKIFHTDPKKLPKL